MKVVLPNGETYKFSCEREAQHAVYDFNALGIKKFKKEFEHKRIKDERTNED